MDAQKRDPDPQETREWLDALDGVLAVEGPDRAHDLIEHLIETARAARRVPAVLGEHRVHQHDPDGSAGAHPRRPGDRASHPLVRALERDGDGAAREQAHQRRRPHRELRVGGDALRRRLQPLLARAVREARRRPRVLPGPLGDRRVRARVHARPPDRRAARQLPAGGRRQRHLVVSASVADARLLAVPDGVDGPRPADGDLPGALHEVPAGPRPRADRRTQGVGVHGRRRDGRAGVDGRDRHGVAREPRQPDLRRQLQPAAPRRAGARQRQDHPGARERLPRRRLERDQGDLGHALGRAARARQEGHPDEADDGSASTASTRRSRARTARTCASTSSTRRS